MSAKNSRILMVQRICKDWIIEIKYVPVAQLDRAIAS